MPAELTVVIPTHNRRDGLRILLASLERQTEPPETFDVVVAIDASTDSTDEMLEGLELPFRLRFIVLDHWGVAATLNRGVEEVKTEFCLLLNDDVVVEPGLVAEHLRLHRELSNAVGFGPIVKRLSKKSPRWARLRALDAQNQFDQLAAGRKPQFTDVSGGNVSFPTSDFRAIGGVTSNGCEHAADLAYRFEQQGSRLVYLAQAITRERGRETLRQAMHAAERRGEASLAFCGRHPAALPYLAVGGGGEPDWRLPAIRHVLLELRIPPFAVAALGAVVRGEHYAARCNSLLFSLCYWRGVRKAVPDREAWQRLAKGTIILMYHAVGRPGERGGRLVVPSRRFRRQMAWLKKRRYTVIGLDELVRCLREHQLAPAKSVVLTFDDGYVDNVEVGLPILEQFGYAWTLFLLSAGGECNSWDFDGELSGRALVSVQQLKELLPRLAVGAHTRTHVDLTAATAEDARREVVRSLRELESGLGVPVRFFAYPYGRYDEDVRKLVIEAGFEAACSIHPATNLISTDLFALRRFEVRGTDSLLRFAMTVWLGDMRALLRRA